ncbi:hypothetical protein AaE_008704 [Aphanomyces astaci]|uniref:Uncharacterized protein n=1 Tax=Aphanomyces astaci TaxID=112090 RepID=A0A6A5A6Y4_APHAT|nr:hypothetical protein AaE_008704 [Aphanomyces astaci]
MVQLMAEQARQKERWEGRIMQAEECAVHVHELFTHQARQVARLEARNSAHDHQLQRQVADAHIEMDKLRRQDAVWASQVAARDGEIARLINEQDKTRQQAIVDTLQREGSQAHINSLRAQISLLKREKEVLRKESTRYMAERDDLLRVLPVVTSISTMR